ncbi:MAG TPA: heparan-alpha-glucosaminide N-acetyltransferase domain-containing protein [Vicinamibacteria bacterium]|nr:heparan-alpha-glucosaminide N-acetyltransferase domain-containing protein [Vicinamibacteria bacterium]
MTTMPAAAVASEPVPRSVAPSPGRLLSLDVFRGATIAGMILVNNPGDESVAYWPLLHAQWNGWTPTDLVFPFFLFIVGVSMSYSFRSRLDKGASRAALMKHVLWRGLVLFALGMFLNGFPDRYHLSSWRVYGVLQRIAICYVIAAMLALWTGRRGQIVAAASCLLGYWVLMRFVPVPGFGVPTHDVPLLDPDRNIVAWLDRKLLMGHLYEVTRDPEGVLSTIPAVATALLGLLTGEWLRSSRGLRAKALGMVGWGAVGLVTGELLGLFFPINKKLWTSSYVVFTAGVALVCLAVCYWVLDVQRWRRWATPFLVLGMNAIAAYVFAAVVAHLIGHLGLVFADGTRLSWQQWVYQHAFSALASPPNASLLYSLAFVALCWAAMWVLYRRKIFLKI